MHNLLKLPIIILISLSYATYAKNIKLQNNVNTQVDVQVTCDNDKHNIKNFTINKMEYEIYSVCPSANNIAIDAWVRWQETTTVRCYSGSPKSASQGYTVSLDAQVGNDYHISCKPM